MIDVIDLHSCLFESVHFPPATVLAASLSLSAIKNPPRMWRIFDCNGLVVAAAKHEQCDDDDPAAIIAKQVTEAVIHSSNPP